MRIGDWVQLILVGVVICWMWRLAKQAKKVDCTEHCKEHERLLASLGIRMNVIEIENVSLRRRVSALERKIATQKGTANG